jgi:predicted RecB family endonuclease
MARKTFEPADPHYAEITDKELVKVFLIKDAVKKYLEAVDAYLYQKTTSGSKFEGLKLVMGRKGNQTWENKDESIEFLEAMVGEEVFKERDLKTPTQIKKLSPELEKDIEALTFRPEAKMKLVSQADKGKEISVDVGADAQAVFSSK